MSAADSALVSPLASAFASPRSVLASPRSSARSGRLSVRGSACGSVLVSVFVSGLPACAVARRRRRSPAGWSSLAGWPGMSICCWAAALSAGAGAAAVSSPVRAFEVARRLGLLSVSAAAGAADLAAVLGAAEPPPACASLMTSISWLLRIRAVPLIPRPDATCCSSARTMPSRPVPERRRRAVVPVAAPSAGAGLSTLLSAVAPIRSVVSLTKGPSLERTSAFWLGDRLCCPTAVC